MSSVATHAARNAGLDITSRGISAAGPMRRSIRANAMSIAADTPNSTRIRASDQPQAVTWSRAISSAMSPTVSVAMPR